MWNKQRSRSVSKSIFQEYPWPPDKAPWSRERGGTGVPPPGAVKNFRFEDNKEELKLLPGSARSTAARPSSASGNCLIVLSGVAEPVPVFEVSAPAPLLKNIGPGSSSL